MKKNLLNLLALILCLIPNISFAKKNIEIHKTSPISLDGYESSILNKNGEVEDFVFLEDDLYLLGSHNLWKWDLSKNSLKKIQLQKKENGVYKLKNLGTDGFNIFAASSSTLYQYSPDKNQILKYASPFGKSGLTLGFAGNKDNFWWIHSKGIMRVDQFGRTLIPTFPLKKITRKNKYVFDYLNKYFWYLSDTKLHRVDFTKKKLASKNIFASKSHLQDIALSDNNIILMSKKSVLRLSENGDLHQAIPVEGHRTLVAMETRNNRDHFLFSDGLLEIYDRGNKSVKFYIFQNLPVNDITQIKSHGEYVALKSHDKILVYKLASD